MLNHTQSLSKHNMQLHSCVSFPCPIQCPIPNISAVENLSKPHGYIEKILPEPSLGLGHFIHACTLDSILFLQIDWIISMNQLTSLSCRDVTSLALGLLLPVNEKVLLRCWNEVTVLERRMCVRTDFCFFAAS